MIADALKSPPRRLSSSLDRTPTSGFSRFTECHIFRFWALFLCLVMFSCHDMTLFVTTPNDSTTFVSMAMMMVIRPDGLG